MIYSWIYCKCSQIWFDWIKWYRRIFNNILKARAWVTIAIHIDPCLELVGRSSWVSKQIVSLQFHIWSRHAVSPYRISSKQFQAFFTSLLKAFLVFPSWYVFPIVPHPYLAPNGIYSWSRLNLPNNRTCWRRLMVVTRFEHGMALTFSGDPSRERGPDRSLSTCIWLSFFFWIHFLALWSYESSK